MKEIINLNNVCNIVVNEKDLNITFSFINNDLITWSGTKEQIQRVLIEIVKFYGASALLTGFIDENPNKENKGG